MDLLFEIIQRLWVWHDPFQFGIGIVLWSLWCWVSGRCGAIIFAFECLGMMMLISVAALLQWLNEMGSTEVASYQGRCLWVVKSWPCQRPALPSHWPKMHVVGCHHRCNINIHVGGKGIFQAAASITEVFFFYRFLWTENSTETKVNVNSCTASIELSTQTVPCGFKPLNTLNLWCHSFFVAWHNS